MLEFMLELGLELVWWLEPMVIGKKTHQLKPLS